MPSMPSWLNCCAPSSDTSSVSNSASISNHDIHVKQGSALAKWRCEEFTKINSNLDRYESVQSIDLNPFIGSVDSRIKRRETRQNDPHLNQRLEARLKQLKHLKECVSRGDFKIVGVLGFHAKADSKDVPKHLSVSEVDSVVIMTKSDETILIALYSNVENYGIYHHDCDRRFNPPTHESPTPPTVEVSNKIMASTFGVLYHPSYSPGVPIMDLMTSECISTQNPEFNFKQTTDNIFYYIQGLDRDVWFEFSCQDEVKRHRIINNDNIYDEVDI